MTNQELDKIEKILSQALHHENSTIYEFTNNDYNCARSQGEMSNDPYYAEMALRIRDDVDKIINHHNDLKSLLRSLVNQAKLVNNGVSHDT